MGWERATGGRRHTIRAGRAASTALVVGGTALTALLLRPDTALLAKGRGPLGGNPVVVIALAVLSLVGGLVLRDKYQEQVGAARELDPVRRRMADGVSRVLAAATLVVPLLILVLHQFGSPGDDHADGDGPDPLPSPGQDPVLSPSPSQPVGHAGHGTHSGPTRVLLALGITLIVVVVVLAGLRLWRRLIRPPAPEAPATYATADDGQERLARAVDLGRRALRDDPDARAAVIACYAAMEKSLADSGVVRRASDSPQDLLERAVADGLPTGAAAAALTALFREARYSTHPLDHGHRDRAAAALTEIADSLRSRTPGPEAVPGTS